MDSTANSDIDLWAAYTAVPRPHDFVDLPRKNSDGEPIGKVAVWVLTQLETEQAQADAGKYVREVLKVGNEKNETDHAYLEVYNNELAVQLLVRALRNPGNLNIPFCPNAKTFREKLSLDEVAVLFNEYVLVRRKLGPVVSELSEPEMDALLGRLAKGGLASGELGFFTLGLLEALLRHSASRCLDLQNTISSLTAPPDDTTTT